MSRRSTLLLLGTAVVVVCAAGAAMTARQQTSRLHLPAPTGPYAVGTRSVELLDTSRRDPFDPRHRKRRLMIQLWYPSVARGRRATYLPPHVGRVVAAEYGLPRTTFSGVMTNAIDHGRPLQQAAPYPLVVFSPGYSVPRDLYSTLYEELASHGFVVLALDHTYETDAVSFADGSVVRRTLPANPTAQGHAAPWRLMLQVMRTRFADVQFVLSRINRINRTTVGGVIDTHRVGIFGHSLGGLTAAAVAGADARIRAAADLDGSIFGPLTRKAARQPFMIMTHGGDETMERYWSRLGPSRYFVRIDRTTHLNFSDWNVLVPWLRPSHRHLPKLGSMPSARSLKIVRSYLDAFFERYLAGKPGTLLDAPPPYREVTVRR